MTLVAFSIGNIIGTEIFLPKDAPAYIPGKTAIMVLLTVQIFVSFGLRYFNQRLNRQRLKKLDELKAQNGWTDADIQRERERHAFMDLTDREYVPIAFFFVGTAAGHLPSMMYVQESLFHLHSLRAGHGFSFFHYYVTSCTCTCDDFDLSVFTCSSRDYVRMKGKFCNACGSSSF